MILTISGRALVRHGELHGRIARFFKETMIVDDDDGGGYPPPDADGEIEHDENSIHQICFRGDEIIGHQLLSPPGQADTSRAAGSSQRSKQLQGASTYAWSQPSLSARHASLRLKPDGPFLELVQGIVEWGLTNDVTDVTTSIDWCLMAAAVQLRFLVRPLGIPKPLGHEEITALSLSFDQSTLDAIRMARGSSDPVLRGENLQSIIA